MYLTFTCAYLCGFISLGLPDSLLGSGWPVMHSDLNVLDFLYGNRFHGHFRRNDYLRHPVRQADKEIRHLDCNCCQRISDNGLFFIWFFHFKPVLDADYFRNSFMVSAPGQLMPP